MSEEVEFTDVDLLKDYVTVGKQGGSLRVTIPHDIVEELGLEDKERLRAVVGDDFVGFCRD